MDCLFLAHFLAPFMALYRRQNALRRFNFAGDRNERAGPVTSGVHRGPNKARTMSRHAARIPCTSVNPGGLSNVNRHNISPLSQSDALMSVPVAFRIWAVLSKSPRSRQNSSNPPLMSSTCNWMPSSPSASSSRAAYGREMPSNGAPGDLRAATIAGAGCDMGVPRGNLY